ncbi:MAG: Gfo/Idh/MocA family oxidoreductase [Sphingomonas sp.]|uniref:Gfo/Idh/MocA family oxidoreductase n=1 Tax=Sphingomonas longa TaxID=2778730 RepID=A0ABS2D8L1_9SPHN|nr:Gfo/Idh/MocA family oxidoreductase [Microvirga sp. SRT01]MBM6577255.1 Gfo/Idh/MocA family oxidoreductase [Sphingomonas sp. BT552]MBR7710299.1 Gfo/Idh/MocA family oxidoreductase [Microvirga sp. SRT01]RZM23074.1 MAG: Gfo/Idh/MocA family oxidoreductase [Sphingomonas sp.]
MEIERRDVLLSAAALAIGMAAPACAAAPRKLGYAIVGLGYYGLKVIIPKFADCEHSRLAAVVSGDPIKARRVAAEHGLDPKSVYSYADFDRIRDNPDVDIVYVCLPNSMHAEYTIRAAKAGKHVLCEKPMAISVAECEAMIAACRRANRQLMIGYRSHFEPHNLEAMRLARTGAAGKIRYVRSEHGFVQGDPQAWRLKKALSGGGSLMDMGIYSLQAARYMTGEEPIAVTARESTDRRDPRFTEVEDIIDWTLEFPSGAIASCQSMYSANQNHILLMGDKGRIELEPATRYDGNQMWTGRDGREQQVQPPSANRSQFVGQLDHMAECATTNREPIVSGAEGLRDIRIVEAIYRSAREGKTVRL